MVPASQSQNPYDRVRWRPAQATVVSGYANVDDTTKDLGPPTGPQRRESWSSESAVSRAEDSSRAISSAASASAVALAPDVQERSPVSNAFPARVEKSESRRRREMPIPLAEGGSSSSKMPHDPMAVPKKKAKPGPFNGKEPPKGPRAAFPSKDPRLWRPTPPPSATVEVYTKSPAPQVEIPPTGPAASRAPPTGPAATRLPTGPAASRASTHSAPSGRPVCPAPSTRPMTPQESLQPTLTQQSTSPDISKRQSSPVAVQRPSKEPTPAPFTSTSTAPAPSMKPQSQNAAAPKFARSASFSTVPQSLSPAKPPKPALDFAKPVIVPADPMTVKPAVQTTHTEPDPEPVFVPRVSTQLVRRQSEAPDLRRERDDKPVGARLASVPQGRDPRLPKSIDIVSTDAAKPAAAVGKPVRPVQQQHQASAVPPSASVSPVEPTTPAPALLSSEPPQAAASGSDMESDPDSASSPVLILSANKVLASPREAEAARTNEQRTYPTVQSKAVRDADESAISLSDLEALEIIASAECTPARGDPLRESPQAQIKQEPPTSFKQVMVYDPKRGVPSMPPPRTTSVSVARSMSGVQPSSATATARPTSSRPIGRATASPIMHVWIEDGISDINRWNLEDRLQQIPNVILTDSIESAEFVLLDLPPGRTAVSSLQLAVFTRPLIPLSNHWALFSAREGKIQDVLPYLVFPAPMPMLKEAPSQSPAPFMQPSPAPRTVSPEVRLSPEVRMSVRPREPETDSEADMPLKKRKSKKSRTIESPTPELSPNPLIKLTLMSEPFERDKARRFIEEYNRHRCFHKKWVRISKEIDDYQAGPAQWREYMEENMEALVAAGLRPASPKVKRARLVPKRIPSTAQLSASEAEASSDDEDAPLALKTTTVSSKKDKRRVVGAHLMLLDKFFAKHKPKHPDDYDAVYEDAAAVTAMSDVVRSKMGFLHLHRVNSARFPTYPVPGRKSQRPSQAYQDDDAEEETEASELDAAQIGSEHRDGDEEEAATEAPPEVVASETRATQAPEVPLTLADRVGSDDETTLVALTSPDEYLDESKRRQILLEHLKKWDPLKVAKVKYIRRLSILHPSRRPSTWYNDFCKERKWLLARLPAGKKLEKPTKKPYRKQLLTRGPPQSDDSDSHAADPSQLLAPSDLDDEDLDDIVLSHQGKASPTPQKSTSRSPFAFPARDASSGMDIDGDAPASDAQLVKEAAKVDEPLFRQYQLARWISPPEQDDLERFVATRDAEVEWSDIFEQWSHICSALPFEPKDVQIIVQLIDYDAFEENLERRRSEAEEKKTEIFWTTPKECSSCEGRSPDLVDGICFDCRTGEDVLAPEVAVKA